MIFFKKLEFRRFEKKNKDGFTKISNGVVADLVEMLLDKLNLDIADKRPQDAFDSVMTLRELLLGDNE